MNEKELSIQDLADDLEIATTEQINTLFPDLDKILKGMLHKPLLWSDGISTNKDNEIPHSQNKVAMRVINDKKETVNIAFLPNNSKEKLGLLSHGKGCYGASILGDIDSKNAFLLNIRDYGDLENAFFIADQIKENGKDKEYCILLAFSNIEHIARMFNKTYNLTIPTFEHIAIELRESETLPSNVTIMGCLEPTLTVRDWLKGEEIEFTQTQKQSFDFFYQGGKFIIKDNKVVFSRKGKDDEKENDTWICSALHIDGLVRDKTSNGWGRLLRFTDRNNVEKTWVAPLSMLIGDSKECLKTLADMGLFIKTEVKAQSLLVAYINEHPNDTQLLSVDKVGWCIHNDNKAYVLPHRVFGDGVILQMANGAENVYAEKGTLEEWKKNVALFASYHNRLVFCICVAFAGAILHETGITNSIGFHFVGLSSMGKSLALKLASSVWGNPSEFIRTWRATGNGLEGVASMHNDGFLALDEIGECEPKQIGETVYMLGNGVGKTRMNKSTQTRTPKRWLLAFLSTGEKNLEDLLKSVGKDMHAGQAVRLMHINADAGHGLGMFDEIGLANSSAETARNFEQAVSRYYGTAGIEWAKYLSQNETFHDLQDFIDDFMKDYQDLPNQAIRVCKHFAVVAGAGELATRARVTGWLKGTATKATKVCFEDWLNTYGKYGDLNLQGLIDRICNFIIRHKGTRIEVIEELNHRPPIYPSPRTRDLAGYVITTGTKETYLLTSETFKELCGSMSPRDASNALYQHGLLIKNKEKGLQFRKKINNIMVTGYAISQEIFDFTNRIDNEPTLDEIKAMELDKLSTEAFSKNSLNYQKHLN